VELTTLVGARVVGFDRLKQDGEKR